jgi:hypothetical protein
MSSAITQKKLIAIADIIRCWPNSEKLTWEGICFASKLELDFVPTRQALANKAVIVNAYKAKKKELRTHARALDSFPIPKSMNAAVDTILRIKKENALLKAELNAMAEVAQLFIHNAYLLHGMTKAQLMKPMLKIKRKES